MVCLLCVVNQQIIHPAIQPRKKIRTCENEGHKMPPTFKKRKNILLVMAVKAPGDLYSLAMSQVSYNERTNTTMVTKDWSAKIGLKISQQCT